MSTDDCDDTLIEQPPLNKPVRRKLIIALLLVLSLSTATYYFAGDAIYWSLQPLPHPLLEIECGRLSQCANLEFSPNGEYLAFGDFDKGQFSVGHGTKIVRLSDQKLVHAIPCGPKSVAWSHDGQLIVTAGMTTKEGETYRTSVELWETIGWTRVDTLVHTSTVNYFFYYFTGLDFDQRGNLFASYQKYYNGETPEDVGNQLSVWWNTKPERIREAEPVANTSNEWGFDSSVASIDENKTRLLVTGGFYPTRKSGICEVWDAEFDATGKGNFRLAYSFDPKFKPGAEKIYVRPCLSAGGKYAGLLYEGKFRIYRLYDDHAELVFRSAHSLSDSESDMHFFFRMTGQIIDASADGRLFAYLNDADQPVAVRVTDGQEVLAIPRKARAVTLSADGQFLATSDFQRGSVCIYQIPQDEE